MASILGAPGIDDASTGWTDMAQDMKAWKKAGSRNNTCTWADTCRPASESENAQPGPGEIAVSHVVECVLHTPRPVTAMLPVAVRTNARAVDHASKAGVGQGGLAGWVSRCTSTCWLVRMSEITVCSHSR